MNVFINGQGLMTPSERAHKVALLQSRDRRRQHQHLRIEGEVYADTLARLRAENEAEAARARRSDTKFIWMVVGFAVSFEIAMGVAAWWWVS